MTWYVIDHSIECHSGRIVAERETLEEIISFINGTSEEDFHKFYDADKEYSTIACDIQLRPDLRDASVIERIKKYADVGFFK